MYKWIYWNIPYWVPLWRVEMPRHIIDENNMVPTSEHIIRDSERYLDISREVLSEKFFSLYRVNLDEECPLWAREDICTSKSLCTLEKCCDDVVPSAVHNESVVIKQGIDDPWDHFQTMKKGSGDIEGFYGGVVPNTDYYDLTVNVPGNTQYKGKSLWSYIYKNACFPHNQSLEGYCDEGGVYNRMISGMQTVIAVLASEYSTSGDDNMLGITYNSEFFKAAVAHNRTWIENMYFTYGLLNRSLCKLKPLLSQLECPQGDVLCTIYPKLLENLDTLQTCKHYDLHKDALFNSLAVSAVDKLEEVDRIMNCVECDKCRLHAKVKIDAFKTAIKSCSVYEIAKINRNQIVALLYAMRYFAEGIVIIQRWQFRIIVLRSIWLAAIVFCVVIIVIFSNRMKKKKIKNKQN